MRRVFTVLLSLLVLVALTACGGEKRETTPYAETEGAGDLLPEAVTETPTALEQPVDAADALTEEGVAALLPEAVSEIATALDMSQDAVDALIADGFAQASSAGMTDYSIEELIAALESGAHSLNSPLWDVEIDENGDLREDATGVGMVVSFSDAPWAEKAVEVLDLTEGMTEEEKAEWEEFENSDWSELINETESMVAEMTESLGGDAVGESDEEGESGGGSDVSLDGSWPDNEFTKGLPAPDFQVTMTTADEYSFTAAFSGITKAQAVAYAETLKKAGFSANAETVDQKVYGMTIYVYSADNAAGYHGELTFSSSGSTLTISK